MTKIDLRRLEALQLIVKNEVGWQLKWNSLKHLHEYLLKCKSTNGGVPDFRGLPLDFCIEQTRPREAPGSNDMGKLPDLFTAN